MIEKLKVKKDKYKELGINFKNVDPGFTYNSGSNPEFLNVKEIQELIIKNVDPEFKPIWIYKKNLSYPIESRI